jgi:hypothetical protein
MCVNYLCSSCRLCVLCLFIILGKNRIILRFRDFNARLRLFVTVNAVCVCVCVRIKCIFQLIFEAICLFTLDFDINSAIDEASTPVIDCVWNVMAHAQKPDFVFRRNGRVNRRGRQFSRLLAADVCPSAVVMLDTPCSEVVWRVLATHSICQFPFTSPTVRHRVPSRFNWTLPKVCFTDPKGSTTSSHGIRGYISAMAVFVMICRVSYLETPCTHEASDSQ